MAMADNPPHLFATRMSPLSEASALFYQHHNSYSALGSFIVNTIPRLRFHWSDVQRPRSYLSEILRCHCSGAARNIYDICVLPGGCTSLFLLNCPKGEKLLRALKKLANMPVESQYPRFEVPNVDLWNFLFERKDKPYPDDKSI